MSESENNIRKILKGLEIPIIETKNLKLRKVRVLNCKSVIEDGFGGIIGKEFNVIFEFENSVCIEYNNENITLKTGEYKIIE